MADFEIWEPETLDDIDLMLENEKLKLQHIKLMSPYIYILIFFFYFIHIEVKTYNSIVISYFIALPLILSHKKCTPNLDKNNLLIL